MKKLILLVTMVIASVISAHAQTDTVMYITEMDGEVHNICFNQHERAIIFGPDGCAEPHWLIDYNQQLIGDSIILDGNNSGSYLIDCGGWNCGQYSSVIYFKHPTTPCETTDILWKHQDETLSIVPVGADSLEMYDFHWNTGETTPTIEVTEPGIYTCGISDQCATATRTFIVRDNVELYRATVDLETKLNKVTWQTTPEQTEYISEVKVERDGMVVGTAPYEQGYFLDNIGSENAARNYRLTAITTDGTECPIPSYQKGTLHVDYSPNASNPNKLNMAWTPPFIEDGAPISVSYFQICKYDPATGEVTVVDQLGANNTIGSYDVSLFDGGYAVVAAMFNEGKEYEELSFSNLTDFLVGIEENEGPSTGSGTLTVYPNPANGVLYVETRHATSLPVETYRIDNPIGQTVMEGQITAEKQQIDVRNLPQGVYFISVGGATRKFVVE